jgi:general secretion pathway protein D
VIALKHILSKNKKRLFLSALLAFTATQAMFVNPVLHAEETAQINLRDVEIPTLIETVSRITGKSFVVDPRVKGRVTVITSQDISDDELYETFLSILQVHGFSAVPSGSGNLIKIVPSNQAKQQPVPLVNDQGQKETRKKRSSSSSRALYERYKKRAGGKKTGLTEAEKALVNKTPQRKITPTRVIKTTPKADELITRVIRVEHVPAAMLVPILRPLVPSTGQLQAYGPSNTIVISDRAANIDRLIGIIKRMDRADDEEIEVVPLKYASAKTLAQTIQTLQQPGIKGVRGKNKVAADLRTNSLLLSGDKSARQVVKRIIRKLDTPQKVEDKTKVIYLRYAKAEELAKVLTGVSKTKKSTKPTSKGAAGTQPAKVDIQADAASNSLIITAEPDMQANLAKVIRRLDVRRAQVLVEAVIAEVGAKLSKTLGASLGLNSKQGIIGGSGTVTTISALLGFLTNGTTAGLVPPDDGGRLGLADNIGSNRFGLLIDALSGDGATNILSTPTVIAMDNEEASIVVGENVPFVTGSFTSTGNTSSNPTNPFQTIERQDVGITLKIKPQINAGTSIRLEIEQEVSSLTGGNSSAAERITNKRSIKTKVMVEDGQVLILGGLMTDTFRDRVSKVPGLGNLPVVGKLFTHTTTEKEKTNLMVFIHPVIMRDVLSADHYTRQKYNKLRKYQINSRINRRGILDENAKAFPNDVRTQFIRKLTPQQRKQQLQQQRKLQQQRARQARNPRQYQGKHKMAQQKAAAQRAKYRTQGAAPVNKPLTRAAMKQNAAKQQAFKRRSKARNTQQPAQRRPNRNNVVAPRAQSTAEDFLNSID